MSPPKSLMELAIMTIIKNIKELEDVGELPFHLLKDILMKVDNAPQLRKIELNCPQILGKTGDIWLKIIQSEFPRVYKANPYKPQDPKRWYRVWEKYKKEHDDDLAASENILKNALAGIKQDKEKNTSKIVEGKRLPGTGRVGPKRQYGPRDASTKTLNGASAMRKMRRQAREITSIHSSLSRPVAAPSRPSKQAPKAMVDDQRRAAQPAYRPAPKEPAKPSALELHEQRASFISDSEDDQDDSAPLAKTAVKPKQSSAADAKAQPATKPVARKPVSTALQRKFGRSPMKTQTPVTTTTTTPTTTTAPKQQAIAKPAVRKQASPTTPQKPSSSSTLIPSYLPRTRTTPPRNPSEGPSSPQSAEELLASLEQPKPAVQSRKRKTVDIFMRPKRRAM